MHVSRHRDPLRASRQNHLRGRRSAGLDVPVQPALGPSLKGGAEGGVVRFALADQHDGALRCSGGRERGDLPGRVRWPEPLCHVPGNQHFEPRGGAVDCVWHPGSGDFRAVLRDGPVAAGGGADAGAAGAAHCDCGGAGGPARGATRSAAGELRPWSDALADDLEGGSSQRYPGHSDGRYSRPLAGHWRDGAANSRWRNDVHPFRAGLANGSVHGAADSDLRMGQRNEPRVPRSRRERDHRAAAGAVLHERAGDFPAPALHRQTPG